MDKINELRIFAEEIRQTTFETFSHTLFGHIGGAMSVVETLAVLYSGIMHFKPEEPGWPERDKLVMSKGHAGPALYAALALRGFFPAEMLSELNKGGGRLPSHCDRSKTPGVDMTTGSLGQGVSTAAGIALGDRMDGRSCRTFLITGDGELNEGQNWEGFMFAAHYKLDRLIMFVDDNGLQLDGATKDVMDLGDISGKLGAFGWHTLDVQGHDVASVLEAVNAASANTKAPSAIVLHTVKGHGCTFAEGKPANHHMTFTKEQIDAEIELTRQRIKALRELTDSGRSFNV